MRNLFKLAALSGAFLISGSAGANVIDLFTDPVGGQVVSDVVNGGNADNTQNFSEVGNFPASIIGGYRDIKVDAISGANDGNSNGICETGDDCTVMNVGSGTLTFNNDTGVVGEGLVQWDGQDNSSDLNTTGLGGLNLINQPGCPASGCTDFVFEVLNADQGFEFQVGVWSNSSKFTNFILESDGTAGTNLLPFANFQNASLCGAVNPFPGVKKIECGSGDSAPVNLTDVGAIQVLLNTAGTTAVDLRIGAIQKVPEPSVLALLGIGFLATGGIFRRKQSSLVTSS